MIIKETNNIKSSPFNNRNNFFRKYIFNIKIILVVFIFGIVAVGYFSSNALKSKGYTGVWDFAKTVLSNYWKGMDANPEKISIEIKEKDYKFLEKNRETALERNLIINNIDGEYVPASLEYQGKKIQIKLRLKGHMTDHLQNNKWSFRIKVEGHNSFMGMKRFSIQHPGTRGYVYEWIYHELMKREDIIALRYKFINISINGRDWGIYAVEESFDNALIENNHRKSGPIIRLNPDLYWVDRYNEILGSRPIAEFASYYSANPEAFNEDDVLADSTQRNYYLKAIALLEGLRSKKLSVEQVFDIERLAKFHAITDLVGGEHSLDWSDTKYYYNPVTEKLEPISYESFTDFPLRVIAGNYRYVQLDSNTENYDDWHTALFSNPMFFKAYIHQLERVSETFYLDNFFNDEDKELKKNLAILYKEFPYKKYDKETYYQNQLMIKKILSPPQAFNAYFNHSSGKQIYLQIGAIESLPIEIKNISFDDKLFTPLVPIVMPSKQKNHYVDYKTYSFLIPNGVTWNDSIIKSLKINYSILGASAMQQAKVFPFPHTDAEFIVADLKNKPGNINEFPFLEVDEQTKSIHFKYGKQIINKDLIIPKGYTIYANAGVSIDIKSNAKIISYSSFIFEGSEDKPILIESSDTSSEGIEFINSHSSTFENVTFKNLPGIHDNQWARSAAITFYESNVTFNNCSFYNSNSDNAINLIRSDYLFKQCFFDKINHSALKIEFSGGIINNCVFENCNKDALYVMMGNLRVTSTYFNGTGNKVISLNEGAQFVGYDIKIKNSKIAIYAEGLSTANLNKVDIENSETGLLTYTNTHSTGSPVITTSEIIFKDVKRNYLKQNNSTIIVNGVEIKDEAGARENINLNDKKTNK